MQQVISKRNFIKSIGIGSLVFFAPIAKAFSKTRSKLDNSSINYDDGLKSDVFINDKAIDSVQEAMSIVVSIEEIDDDISHTDGFQVTLYGKSDCDGDVEIVNLFEPNEKVSMNELVKKVIPGTNWLITGDPLISGEYNTLVLFAYSYQRVKLPINKMTDKDIPF